MTQRKHTTTTENETYKNMQILINCKRFNKRKFSEMSWDLKIYIFCLFATLWENGDFAKVSPPKIRLITKCYSNVFALS